MRFFLLLALVMQFSLYGESYASMKKKAYAKYENNDKKAAYEIVNAHVKAYPDDFSAQNLLAVFHYWDGDLPKAKSLLEAVVQKGEFPQARDLLKIINQKLGVSDAVIHKQEEVKISQIPIPENKESDLLYLVARMNKNPHDLVSRKLIAQHYAKIGNTKKAFEVANEALGIDPDDKEMLRLVQKQESFQASSVQKENEEKSYTKLAEFYAANAHEQYLNLYSALEHNNVAIPPDFHVKALFCAVALEQYAKAKSIMHLYKMPNSKYVSQVEALIDQKLLNQRFASTQE